MREEFLHFLWRYRRFDFLDLRTTSGELVEIISTGEWNRLHAGPDFSGARIRIGDTLWIGHVEMHIRSSEWHMHGHTHDAAYENVILHVVLDDDAPVKAKNGQIIPCVELKARIQADLWHKYMALQQQDQAIACSGKLADLPAITQSAWLDRVSTERLEQRSKLISSFLETTENNWEKVFWMMLARSMGGQTNGDPMQWLMERVPLKLVARLVGRPAAIDALLLGLAGLLPNDPEDGYTKQLNTLFSDLQVNHHLVPLDAQVWKMARMRPASFPVVKVIQLSALMQARPLLWSQMLETPEIDLAKDLLVATPDVYWHNHIAPNRPYQKGIGTPGNDALDRVLINAVVPLLFQYGRERDLPHLIDRALYWLQILPAEDNHLIREWADAGITAANASDSQALLQLYAKYCTPKKCLQCAIGLALLKTNNLMVNEEDQYFFSKMLGNLDKSTLPLRR